MSVVETIGAIRNGLMWIGLWTLDLCLVALLACAISGKRHWSLPVVATSATILRGKRRDAASPGGTKDAGCIGFETFLIQNLDKN